MAPLLGAPPPPPSRAGAELLSLPLASGPAPWAVGVGPAGVASRGRSGLGQGNFQPMGARHGSSQLPDKDVATGPPGSV